MNGIPNKKTSLLWLLLPVIVLVLGVAGFAVLLYGGISGIEEKLTRVVVPGEETITLTEAGTYTVFHEHQSVVDGKTYSNPPTLEGLTVTLTSEDSGVAIPLSSATASSNYDLGSKSGVGVGQFEISAPGQYVLSASYAPGQDGPEVVLTLVPGFMGGLAGTIFGAFASCFGSLALAVILTIVILVKRFRSASPPAAEPPRAAPMA